MTGRKNVLQSVARTGFFTKGLVYCLIGLLAFMSAFGLKGQRVEDSDRSGVFNLILDQPLGKVILSLIAAGLLCYSGWRLLQAFLDTEQKGNDMKGLGSRAAYLFSALSYLLFAVLAASSVLGSGGKSSGGGSSGQTLAQKVLEQPGGQWWLLLIALFFVGLGLHQLWYGNSEKYKKSLDVRALDEKASASLLRAGKIGHIARGIVWLIIAFFFFKAGIHQNAAEAGDTTNVFRFVYDSPYGKYLLAALGAGLVCYGVMNFIRAVFERLNTGRT
ncbi:DUF1206 domain-containing protein [Pedobacter sp. SYSU D00535]|uniref:DUF1206 domain-containing protein n=1 Tax=Pedobacter sp. SYSU D00535 TaxID=2810308 RepID=UPI001A96DA22|nr:DUF1206 domain-containing protein [Pedobacter sp. SYSU D00535]